MITDAKHKLIVRTMYGNTVTRDYYYLLIIRLWRRDTAVSIHFQ